MAVANLHLNVSLIAKPQILHYFGHQEPEHSIMSIKETVMSAANSIGSMASRAFDSASQMRPSLSDIERFYHIIPEGRYHWTPNTNTFGIERSAYVTNTEGKLLDTLVATRGLMGLAQAEAIRIDSFSTAVARIPSTDQPPQSAISAIDAQIQHYPADQQASKREELIDTWNGNYGHQDAFRHAYWSARQTQAFGADWANQFTSAHEGFEQGQTTTAAMDLYNNKIGQQIALQNPNASPQELADLVMFALDNGYLTVVSPAGRLTWSNEIARYHHGFGADVANVEHRIRQPMGDAIPN
jgi:hypothetical protein